MPAAEDLHQRAGGEGSLADAGVRARVTADEDAGEIAARLASMGKLAARVAHELNGSLDGVIRFVNLSLRLAGEAGEPRMVSYLSQSRKGLLRMAGMVTDLLAYSRGTAGWREAPGVHQVIEEAIRSHAIAAEAARVIVAVDAERSDLPVLSGSRLLQVCSNLIRNAIDAMPQGGRLTIRYGLVGGRVNLRFEDTGLGLPEPVEQVFELFFTTKAPGQGTGLGLAICREFIEGMGGTISAERGAQGGAVFTISLPAVAGAMKDIQASMAGHDATSGAGRSRGAKEEGRR